MSFMKPNKPGSFDGTRDAMTVRAWLHSVEKYLRLIQVGQATQISAETAVDFASTFMTGTAANWWYTIVHEGKVPPTWEAFKLLVETEFVPQDSVIRARDRLNKLRQRTSVAAYLAEFRNVVIDIPDMSGEKLARFSEGLKPHILLEVRKENPMRLDAAATIALSVDGAYYGAGFFSGYGNQSSGFMPMEIGNFERNNHRNNASRQKWIDRKKGQCFVCHKRGCRADRHNDDKKPAKFEDKQKNKKVSWNNTQVKNNEEDSSDEEN